MFATESDAAAELMRWLAAQTLLAHERTPAVATLVELGDRIDDLQRGGQWLTLDLVLGQIEPARTAHALVITLLGTTYLSRARLPSWRALAHAAAARRTSQGHHVRGLLRAWIDDL